MHCHCNDIASYQQFCSVFGYGKGKYPNFPYVLIPTYNTSGMSQIRSIIHTPPPWHKILTNSAKTGCHRIFFVVRMQIMHILACATNSIHLLYHCMLYHCMLDMGVVIVMLAWASKSVAALADPYHPKTRCYRHLFGTAHGSHTYNSMYN